MLGVTRYAAGLAAVSGEAGAKTAARQAEQKSAVLTSSRSTPWAEAITQRQS